jgi:hypothetical protein
VQAFWLAAGGSILAAEHALEDRVAFNIGGGSTMLSLITARAFA